MTTKDRPKQELSLFGRSLTFWILLALVGGFFAGIALHAAGDSALTPIFTEGVFAVGGQVFFSLLQFLVVPVVLFSLICGVGGMDNIRAMGRIGGKTLGYYLVSTGLAVTLAILASLLTNPGVGFALESTLNFTPKEAPSLAETFLNIVPKNPIAAMAQANMLQIIVMSILIGLALSLSGAAGKRVLSHFQDLNEVIMKMVTLVMIVAPVGVFCLIAGVFAKQGFAAILPLSKYFFTVFGVLVLHLFLVYGLFLKIVGGISPFGFFKKFREVMVFAFSTSSSNATLPVTMEVVEHQLGVKNSVASFTLPLGATVNMDGTAIMQGVATLFIAQAYGIDLGLSELVMVVVTATLASIGTAGVPGVGLIMLAMVLKQVNLPVEGIGLIIGVDRLLDMTRTVVNVTGDAVVTCVVAKSEKQLDEKVLLAEA